ncbi:MAG: hypothetical protein WDO15_00150 [Bacteroidota bacterium]
MISFGAHAQEKILLYPDDKSKNAPFIEYFPASSQTTLPFLFVPVGGYTHLAVDHEGKDVAKFYNQNGFDAWVLHYRLNDDEQRVIVFLINTMM